MPKTLGFHLAYRVVSEALNRVAKWDSVEADTPLKRILTDAEQREKFRQLVEKSALERTSATTVKLPKGANVRLTEFANIIASLPCDSGTDDPP